MEAPAQVLRDQAEATSIMDAFDQVLPSGFLQLCLGRHVPGTGFILAMPPIFLQTASFLHAHPMNQKKFTIVHGWISTKKGHEVKATGMLADNSKAVLLTQFFFRLHLKA